MARLFVLSLALVAVAACTPAPVGSTYQIGGQALAGPTCPVQPASPLPGQCAPRPVPGAVLVISDPVGHEVTRATTDAAGRWTAAVQSGTYTVSAQPVQGLLGTARPVIVSVAVGSVPISIEIDYDTGIR